MTSYNCMRVHWNPFIFHHGIPVQEFEWSFLAHPCLPRLAGRKEKTRLAVRRNSVACSLERSHLCSRQNVIPNSKLTKMCFQMKIMLRRSTISRVLRNLVVIGRERLLCGQEELFEEGGAFFMCARGADHEEDAVGGHLALLRI